MPSDAGYSTENPAARSRVRGNNFTSRATADAATKATPWELEISDLDLRFGGVVALSGLSFRVAPGEICGLIGANGAGKSSVFNCISGLYRPSAGEIKLGGTDLRGCAPHTVAKHGVARTFQNVGLVPGMSVFDNVLLGGHVRLGASSAAWRRLRAPRRRCEKAVNDEALTLLARMGLADKTSVLAGTLPFASQKRVELARALLAKPRLLLLDEPASGLTEPEIDDFTQLIGSLHVEFRLTTLLVEHHVGLVCSACERVVVLDAGRCIAEGEPTAVIHLPHVVEAYIGAEQ